MAVMAVIKKKPLEATDQIDQTASWGNQFWPMSVCLAEVWRHGGCKTFLRCHGGVERSNHIKSANEATNSNAKYRVFRDL